MTWISIAHHLPTRTRLACPSIRKDEPACERLADALSAVAGVKEVKVRPYTGSAVIEHTRDVAVATLVEIARRTVGADRVLAQGERPPVSPYVPPFASLARQMAGIARQLDQDILRASDGTIDLGTLATLGFFGAGAAEVIATRKLPVPPWFNLAWYGFRTFMMTEQDEIQAEAEAQTQT